MIGERESAERALLSAQFNVDDGDCTRHALAWSSRHKKSPKQYNRPTGQKNCRKAEAGIRNRKQYGSDDFAAFQNIVMRNSEKIEMTDDKPEGERTGKFAKVVPDRAKQTRILPFGA